MRISSGWPARASGVPFRYVARNSGFFQRASLNRVSISAGATAFTRTPRGASSRASTRVSMITAALVAQ